MGLSSQSFSQMIFRRRFAGDGSTTSFDLKITALISGSEWVHKGGMYQKIGAGNDYTISGTNIIFAAAPANGVPLDVLVLRHFDGLGLVRESFAGDGVATDFVLAWAPQTGGEFVYRGGLFQKKGTGHDYTIAGGPSTIAFESAPGNGANIEVRYFRGFGNLVLGRESFVGDGATTDFPLKGVPIPAGLFVYQGGQLQTSGSGNDFTLAAGSTLSFASAPGGGINIETMYFG